MSQRDQQAGWLATMTGGWWWRANGYRAVTVGRPRVTWGRSIADRGRRAVYAHRVHWVLLAWKRQRRTDGTGWTAPLMVAGWKCRGVSRAAVLCAKRPAGLKVCPKCELAVRLEGSAR